MRWLRPLAATLVAALAVLVPAAPAQADPPKPTNDRSTVVSVTPRPAPGVEVAVVGGDAFLELTVPRGHTAEVPDYPVGSTTGTYLRYLADGRVQVDDGSAAIVLNESRYGTGTPAVDPKAAPRWRTVADDGTYAWHDHRVHWMSPAEPSVGPDGRIDMGGPAGSWTVPLVIDGRPTTVRGELVRLDAPDPWGWYLAAAAVAVVLVVRVVWSARRGVGARRQAAVETLGVVAGIAAGLALWVGLDQRRITPPGAGGRPWIWLVPAVALAGAVVAVLLRGRGRLAGLCAAAAGCVAWAVYRLGVFDHALVPSSLPANLDRAVTALALGVGAGLVVWIVGPFDPDPDAAGAADQEVPSRSTGVAPESTSS